jgi:hypothetical protein
MSQQPPAVSSDERWEAGRVNPAYFPRPIFYL